MTRRAMVVAIVATLMPVGALAAGDPNWPCQQIKVSELSLASIWSGPVIDPNDTTWRSDPEVTDLVQKLAPRREPIDQADILIHDFAQRNGDRKQPRLLLAMVGLFTVLGEERDSVMTGLDRFGGRQKELAAEVRTDNEKLRAAQSDPATDPKTVQQLTQKVQWNIEVFQDRSQAIRYACDVPTKIEQRMFTLARQIQREME